MHKANRLASQTLVGLLLAAPLLLLLSGSGVAAFPPELGNSLVVGGLNTPRSLDFFPNGSILVIENGGGIRLVMNGTALSLGTFSNLSTAGEQGLLGVAIDPDYPARPYMYVHYTSGAPTYVQLARLNFTNASGPGPLGVDFSSRIVLLGDMPNLNTNHNGGTVRFGPDKKLYMSIGDDAQGGGCTAQNLSFMGGKILRVKVDDTIDLTNRATLAPSDNPFASDPRVNATLVWAYGLRNPFRFDIDAFTGKLYIGDVGQNSWEEVDVSAGGENFGWPYWEGNHSFRGTLCPTDSVFPSWTRPIYEYPNPGGASVIMAALYRGVDYPNDSSLPPEFNENPFFFDFYSGNLRVLRFNGTGWALVPGVDSTNFATAMTFVTDMQVGPDGGLYWLSAASNQLNKLTYLAAPTITTSTLPPGTVNVSYSAGLTVAGNAPPPYTWSITSGVLPAGLALSATTGVISGTPTTAGTQNFTVRVQASTGRTDNRSLSIAIFDPVTIATAALADAIQNRSYAATLTAQGGVGPFTWAIEANVLPPGLSLGGSTGDITGTCDAFGSWNFTVSATDSGGRNATKDFSIRVMEELHSNTTSLPQGLQGAWYEASIVVVGGVAPYAFAVNASSGLPAGISLGPLNGTLYGLPTSPNATAVLFDVQDSGGQFILLLLDLVISPIPGDPPLIATVTLPRGTTEVPYAVAWQVAAGTGPFTWAHTNGSLPPGLTFTPSNASLTGIPTSGGNFNFGIRVTDNADRWDERNYSLQVIVRFRIVRITTTELPGAELGVPYGPFQWEASGTNLTMPLLWNPLALPAGLTLAANGILSGTPTGAGSFAIQVRVTDSSVPPVVAVASITINVTRVGLVEVVALPALTVGTAVVLPFELTDPNATVTWTLAAGALPPGLRLDADGTLRGTPTADGNYSFTVRAARTGAPSNYAEANLTVQVNALPAQNPPPPNPTPSPFPSATNYFWLLLLLAVLLAILGIAYGLTRDRKPPSSQ